MKNIYEQIIEHLINDDEAAARQLFHKEIVRQSRDIYNQLVAEEKEEEEDESEEEEEDMEESIMNMDQTDSMMGNIRADQEGMDHDGDMDMGHDDDMDMGDSEDGMGHEEEHSDIEDRVMDLEDKLDQLQAEFAREMGSEEGDDDMDFDSEDDDIEDESIMREYVEKVAKPSNTEGQGVGAGSIGGSTNGKSIVAGKNDMGGSAKNIAQGGANENPDDKQYKKPSNQYTKGEGSLKGAGSYENVPGANAGKAFSNAKKPVSKDGAANTKSPLAK